VRGKVGAKQSITSRLSHKRLHIGGGKPAGGAPRPCLFNARQVCGAEEEMVRSNLAGDGKPAPSPCEDMISSRGGNWQMCTGVPYSAAKRMRLPIVRPSAWMQADRRPELLEVRRPELSCHPAAADRRSESR
jgi:hypothetical protein